MVVSCCNAEQGRFRSCEWCSVPVAMLYYARFESCRQKPVAGQTKTNTNRTAQAEFDPSVHHSVVHKDSALYFVFKSYRTSVRHI